MRTRNIPKTEPARRPAAPKKQPQRPRPDARRVAKPPEPVIDREIYAIIAIVLSIFLLISLFMADGGVIVRLFSSLFAGLFGVGAYILPFCAIALAIHYFIYGQRPPTSKVVMGGIIFVIIISLFHMVGGGVVETEGFWAYLGYRYSSGAASNGGLIGASAAGFFIFLVSRVGTYILFITLALILSIQITGRSFFYGVYKIFCKLKDAWSKDYDEYYEDDYYDDDDIAGYIDNSEPDDRPPLRLVTSDRRSDYISPPRTRRTRRIDYHLEPIDEPDEHDEGFEDDFDEDFEDDEADTSTTFYRRRRRSRPSFEDDVIVIGEDGPASPTAEEALPPVSPVDEGFAIKGIVEGYAPVAITVDELEETQQEEVREPIDFVKPIAREVKEHTPITPITPITPRSEPYIPRPISISMPEPPMVSPPAEYVYPPVELLRENNYQPSPSSRAQIMENSKKLEETLKSFGVSARVVEVSIGPTVTRYEVSPGAGVKVSKISGLADDLALNLAANGIRIEAPIPGKSVVGIEIPNKETQAVFLREVVDSKAFWDYPSKLGFAMGKDIAGNIIIADIAKMPHLLIAGATGAGKSVCINTLIASIIYKAHPDEVKLLMIDPKVVELSVYNGIPHLLIPVVTDPKKASGALAWAVREMDSRYNLFAESMVRDLKGYNAVLEDDDQSPLPQIVIIIDELADLMMTCGKEVEESICRLAQKARAAGIHLIIATQRPSVDVITGLIKANVPSRLAFAVSSGTDSRTILDMTGAEKLLGKGDMLFSPVGLSKPQRIQGSFISDKEVENIVSFIKQEDAPYNAQMIDEITKLPEKDFSGESDEHIDEAISFIIERGKASTSMLQRRFRIGYNRAARMMEELEARGYVGPEDGAKPRRVMIPHED